MKPKVYIETTIPSYLSARPSRDILIVANQEVTREWWDKCKDKFELVISEFVLREASAGHPEAARRREAVLEGLIELSVTDDVGELAQILIDNVPMPSKAELDAFHIAIAAIHGIDYLLTWNCTHIANAILRPKIDTICREFGCEPPIICTPQELSEA